MPRPQLTASARCLACGPLPGTAPADADKAAEKHVRPGHPTAVVVEAVRRP